MKIVVEIRHKIVSMYETWLETALFPGQEKEVFKWQGK